ncbi:MAG: late competence development ComFB family protein [Cyanobacteriota bacterium]|nr:late competence development ComFB family protein [Cyanobacteriota bacterium]
MEMINLNLNTINVMEILIVQETERQLKKLAPNQVQYIKLVEVATYALNRLPSLYASSQEGLNHQLQHAKQQYKPQIIVAVRQGVAAVQRDPLRRSTPIDLKQPDSQTKQQSTEAKFNRAEISELTHPVIKKKLNIYSENTHADYCWMARQIMQQ